MHLYNAWLPPPVAEETKREKESFARVVKSVKESYSADDPESVYSSLKWVSVVDLFIKAKSEVSLEDVNALVEIVLELFQISHDKLYVQVPVANGNASYPFSVDAPRNTKFLFSNRAISPSRSIGKSITTATHQLKTAVTSVAYAGRPLFLSPLSASLKEQDDVGGTDMYTDLLLVSLSNALLGMDANDPPKTLATMQLIGSIFSSVRANFHHVHYQFLLDCEIGYAKMALLEESMDEFSFMPTVRFSEWLDEFLNDGIHSPATSGTFLVEDGPYYFCMLALKKISKFVRTNILPGAIAEVGLLCCACVQSNPQEAVSHLVEPILSSVISSLRGTPVTGFGGSGTFDASVSSKAKPSLSPALETSIDYQLKVLSVAINYGGPALLRYKDQFKEAILSAFESPSWKVNGAGDHVLRSLLGSLVLYYPIDQYKCVLHHSSAAGLEEWISTKDFSSEEPFMGPKWHVPNEEEVQFANELLHMHLESALDDLLRICQSRIHPDPGNEKDHLKVTLLRIDSSLQSVLSCLPDFKPSFRNGTVENSGHASFLIAGASGSSVGSTELRTKAANVIHAACKSSVKCLSKMMKRWPSMISKCVLTLAENLRNPNIPEYAILGSCAVLSTQTVLKHLTKDSKAFSSFLLGILSSSHHESLKAQKAITELFVKYNIYFAGVSRSIFRKPDNHSDGTEFAVLVSEIGSLSFDSSNLHWRYNLMANRVLLLLAMTSRNDPNSSSKIMSETAGHFLKNLKSQLPQTRILAISALNTLLKESPYKLPSEERPILSGDIQGNTKSSLEGALSRIFQEEGFFSETLSSLSNVHVITDTENTSSRGSQGNSSFQSLADKSITRFYFDFSASWPRTPSWISLVGSDTFYSNFARIFKRLVQECGVPVLLALKSALEELVNTKERSKQCVAAEVLAGVLHSDVSGLLESWDSWMSIQLQNIILAPSVESIPEWAACIRYAVTGKGKCGTRAPLLRQRIMSCLMSPLPQTVATTVVAKRYIFLSAALIEVSPSKMPVAEVQLHNELLQELLGNMTHSSPQVRESVGVTLSVLCSNIRLHTSFTLTHSHDGRNSVDGKLGGCWDQLLIEQASQLVASVQNASQSANLETPIDTSPEDGVSNGNSQDDVKWMETSGRSSYLLDVIVGLLYPVISLQETSNKDLSTLAKAAFELLKWRIFGEPYLQKAISIILSSANDSNWRTRSATLTFLRAFMYRHTFILSNLEKQDIWKTVEKLLTDSQVEA
ncbi:hypothetical protein RJ639_042999, partial [Escallonia herrerae]